MNHEKFMQAALVEATKGDLPYGAVIVKDDEIILRGYNTAQTDNDVSAHGEINVLRAFTKKYGYSLDALSGYTLYSAAACVWAGVSRIVFGASSQQVMELGQEQINITCKTITEKGFQNVEVIGGILADECLELFKKI
jgi:tRNA(adenine34) deaminase